MNAVPFDTLKLARDLEAAGVSPAVAAGTAAALADAMASTDFATKADLALTEARLTGALNAAKSETASAIQALDARMIANEAKSDSRFAALDAKLEVLRRDMTIKLGGMIFVAVGVILTAMRLMPHP